MKSSNHHPLRAYRESFRPKMSQAHLGKLVGATKTAVCRWESGERQIDPELLPKLVKATGIPARMLRPDLAQLLYPDFSDPPFSCPPDAA